MKKSIFIVKGISGSGKSSRVLQLLKFFEHIGLTLSDFIFLNAEGKTKVVGVVVEELELVFIGKLYKSGEIERWQGYDAVTGSFCKASFFSDFLTSNLDKYSFVVEGAGITQTHRLRPEFLESIGFKNILLQYYNYSIEGKEDYYKRIIYRSGEKPKKDVMWEKNLGFINDYKFAMEEKVGCKLKNIFISSQEFDEPIHDFGVKFFKFNNSNDLVDEFVKFTEDFDYINTNKFENFQ